VFGFNNNSNNNNNKLQGHHIRFKKTTLIYGVAKLIEWSL